MRYLLKPKVGGGGGGGGEINVSMNLYKAIEDHINLLFMYG